MSLSASGRGGAAGSSGSGGYGRGFGAGEADLFTSVATAGGRPRAAIGALVAFAFLGGAGAGVVASHFLLRPASKAAKDEPQQLGAGERRRGPGGPGGPPPHMGRGRPSSDRSLHRLADELDLTDDEAAAVRAVFEASRTRFEGVFARLGPELEELREKTNAEVRSVLPAEKQVAFDRFLAACEAERADFRREREARDGRERDGRDGRGEGEDRRRWRERRRPPGEPGERGPSERGSNERERASPPGEAPGEPAGAPPAARPGPAPAEGEPSPTGPALGEPPGAEPPGAEPAGTEPAGAEPAESGPKPAPGGAEAPPAGDGRG